MPFSAVKLCKLVVQMWKNLGSVVAVVFVLCF